MYVYVYIILRKVRILRSNILPDRTKCSCSGMYISTPGRKKCPRLEIEYFYPIVQSDLEPYSVDHRVTIYGPTRESRTAS